MFNNSTLNSNELNSVSKQQKGWGEFFSETVSNVEIVNKKVIKKYVSDAITNVEKLLKIAAKMGNDSIVNVAILNKNIIKKFVSDSISNIEIISKVKKQFKIFSETITNTEIIIKMIGKMSNENLSLVESIIYNALRSFRKTRGFVRKLHYSNTVKNVSRSINRIIR